MSNKKDSIQRLSVIVPESPFSPDELRGKKQCLCALDVEKLIEWWPGTAHSPHRNPEKVRNIQRSLDWKRVAQIAAYLLQEEIVDTDEKINKYFTSIYEPKKYEKGREWPPNVKKVTGFERSEYPIFSNILVHVNGAKIVEFETQKDEKAAHLIFDEDDKNLNFYVIDGQHRINGAFFALKILQERREKAKWEIPVQIFVDLDLREQPPKRQAQIFIDVNFYQKKVDRSLVADLFPTTRVGRDPLDDTERAQDIGRKLMLEVGPLVGMIQIPGIKYGVKDVVTLATLNNAIEDVLSCLHNNGIDALEAQTQFIAQCLGCWLEATGRFEDPKTKETSLLDSENVVYQGRVLVSVIALIPAIIWELREKRVPVQNAEKFKEILTDWFRRIIVRAKLEEKGKFITKSRFKQKGYLGSGGIGRFRDTLWAAIRGPKVKMETVLEQAEKNRKFILTALRNTESK
ncbi:MAG: DGQHR domain-containing protein [Candidatus Zixiibacteriota bacterium]